MARYNCSIVLLSGHTTEELKPKTQSSDFVSHSTEPHVNFHLSPISDSSVSFDNLNKKYSYLRDLHYIIQNCKPQHPVFSNE